MINFAMELSSFFTEYGLIIGNTVVLHGKMVLVSATSSIPALTHDIDLEITEHWQTKVPALFCYEAAAHQPQSWVRGKDRSILWQTDQNWSDFFKTTCQHLDENEAIQYSAQAAGSMIRAVLAINEILFSGNTKVQYCYKRCFIKDFLLIFDLVYKLSSFLKDPQISFAKVWIIKGKLQLSNGKNINSKVWADIEITVDKYDILQLPRVVCYNPWVRKDPLGWHIYSSGELCWEFPCLWQEKLLEASCLEKIDNGKIAKLAAEWCINSVITLIYYHWTAHKYNIKDWPPEWNYWKHGEEGLKQYEEEKKARNNKRIA